MEEHSAIYWALGLLSTLTIGMLWLAIRTPMAVAKQVKEALTEMRSEMERCRITEEKRVDEKLAAAEKLNLEGHTNLHHRIDGVVERVERLEDRKLVVIE
jgi:hypothetical protein